jgi:hypothetical protein
MRLKTMLIVALASGIGAAPAQAHEGHESCKAFGQAVSQNAQTIQPWGQVVSNGAQLGFNSALVAEAHTVEGLCEPKP